MFYYGILMIMGNEMAPKDVPQILYVSFVFISGAIIMAIIFGSISTVMASVNQKDTLFQEKMDFVQSTMIKIRLDERIQDEVLNYLEKV